MPKLPLRALHVKHAQRDCSGCGQLSRRSMPKTHTPLCSVAGESMPQITSISRRQARCTAVSGREWLHVASYTGTVINWLLWPPLHTVCLQFHLAPKSYFIAAVADCSVVALFINRARQISAVASVMTTSQQLQCCSGRMSTPLTVA